MISFVFICSYQWGQRKRVTRTHFILYDIGLIWSKHLIKIDDNRQFRSTSDKIPDKKNFSISLPQVKILTKWTSLAKKNQQTATVKHKIMLVDNATSML